MVKYIFACAFSVLLGSSAMAQPTFSPALRTEVYEIASLTLPDPQFLAGASGGQPVTVSGVLRIPAGSGRLPVVVLMHGSGGMGSNIDAWSNDLLSAGIATFAIDGFTGRGLVQVNTNQAALGRLNFIVDVYRSLEVLARHPRVDTSRVVLMGFSRGGQAALYASTKRFNKLWNRSGIEFAAFLPFYPDCMTRYIDDTDLVDRPIHIFHGALDDYSPAAVCKTFAARAAAAGHVVELTEFPNAQHAFDGPLLPVQPVAIKGGQSARHCRFEEQPVGNLRNSQTGAPFTYADACVELDPHVAYDAEATAAAHAAVKSLIAGLPSSNAQRP